MLSEIMKKKKNNSESYIHCLPCLQVVIDQCINPFPSVFSTKVALTQYSALAFSSHSLYTNKAMNLDQYVRSLNETERLHSVMTQ